MENQYLDTDTFIWPATNYSSMFNDFNLPDEQHNSTHSSPVNREISISTFTANVELRRLNSERAEKLGRKFVDLRALEFVETPSESLVCAICAAPFDTPMELGCEHTFCEDCIYEHLTCGLQSAASCPRCRRPIQSLRPVPRLLHQLLDELEVLCPNKDSGCTTTLKRYTTNDHVVHYCDFEEVHCPKSNCTGMIQRRLLEKGCLHTPTECELCNSLVMEKDLADHEDNTCPASYVDCDYCEVELRRGQLTEHLEEDCSDVIIKCPGHVVGCQHEGPRFSNRSHADTCAMATMSSFFLELNERQTRLQDENKNLRSRVESLTTQIEVMEEDHRKLAATIKKERRRSMMVENSAASASRIDEVQARLDEMAADYTSRLDTATSENARLHMELMNTVAQNSQRFYTINGTLTALRTQMNHIVANSNARPSGGAGRSSSGMASGANAGGGVSLDTARREPPKL